MADSMIAPALRRIALLIALAATVLFALPAAARAVTVVSLTFDDGIRTQYVEAAPRLNAHGMHATFYVNSGKIQNPMYGDFHMTWAQVDLLNAQGHEIAGHTIDHVRLTGPGITPPPVDPAEARRQICVDAATLRTHGYQVTDFAYPYGAGYGDPNVVQALADCGYQSARTYGELRSPVAYSSINYPFAETIPPANPYKIRTGFITGPLTLGDLQTWVTNAENNGGGWVPIVFHSIDSSNADETVSPSTLGQFLDWLQPRAASGTVVKTVRDVISPPPPPEPPQPVHAFKDTATAFASLKVRKRQRIGKLYVTAAMIEGGTLSASATVSVPNISRVFKFKRVTKPAVAGKRVKLRLRISKKGLRAALRALRRHKRLRAKITIIARDAVGNSKSAKRTVRLRR